MVQGSQLKGDNMDTWYVIETDCSPERFKLVNDVTKVGDHRWNYFITRKEAETEADRRNSLH